MHLDPDYHGSTTGDREIFISFKTLETESDEKELTEYW
jgi:hypothetical protein